MGDYFKPLRRKIGVVMLVMACVLLAAWVRSGFVSDLFCIQNSETRTQVFVCHKGQLFWCGRLPSDFEQFHSIVPSGADPLKLIMDGHRWSWLGFQFVEGNLRGDATQPIVCWILPWFPIVIPLTLLSAYLLLSRPRVAKPKAITEPIPEKVA